MPLSYRLYGFRASYPLRARPISPPMRLYHRGVASVRLTLKKPAISLHLLLRHGCRSVRYLRLKPRLRKTYQIRTMRPNNAMAFSAMFTALKKKRIVFHSKKGSREPGVASKIKRISLQAFVQIPAKKGENKRQNNSHTQKCLRGSTSNSNF